MKNKYEIRGDVVVIFINRRDRTALEAIIDASDLHLVQEYTGTWHAKYEPKTKSYYVYGNQTLTKNTKTKIFLHRWIIKPTNGNVVDHINGNSLDNRRTVNLREVSTLQNNQNINNLKSTNKSGFRGVYWEKSKQKWRAQLRVNGIKMTFGLFDKAEDAAKVIAEKRAEYMPYSQEALAK